MAVIKELWNMMIQKKKYKNVEVDIKLTKNCEMLYKPGPVKLITRIRLHVLTQKLIVMFKL